MARTVHLGYRCQVCRSRVPVYTFVTNGNGSKSSTPPVDRFVECPSCRTPRLVSFAELYHLDRWEEAAAA